MLAMQGKAAKVKICRSRSWMTFRLPASFQDALSPELRFHGLKPRALCTGAHGTF